MSRDLVPGMTTCVYRHYDRFGNLLYVGITNRGDRRADEHAKTKPWWSVVSQTRYEHYDNRDAALVREKSLIQAHNPPFNVQHNESYKEMRSRYLAIAPDAVVRSAADDDPTPEPAVKNRKVPPMAREYESRIVADAPPLELRTDDDGRQYFRGAFSVFNSRSHDLGGFKEEIDPRAFTRVLRNLVAHDKIQAWFNHNPDNLLATVRAGTLRLWTDERAAWYEFPFDESDPDHQRVAAKAARGDLVGSSFGFRVARDEWGTDEHDYPLRRVLEVAELRDVGPVSMPAYPATEMIGALTFRTLAEMADVDPEVLVKAAHERELRSFLLDPEKEEAPTDEAADAEIAADAEQERSTSGRDIRHRLLELGSRPVPTQFISYQ